ncbi:MAG: cysteine hydrolase [Coriobacteriales bacterium]|jgi:nicotinamidase-related amidase|nr:cysteine hydrolase [Coriobacteriales bacterium]
MPQTAVIVVDMLNDFVTGSLACKRAERIIPPLVRLISAAREAGVPVVYTNDSHLKGIDHELALWGEHAMRGSAGAEVIPELAPCELDYVILKRRYSGFFQTDLNILLKELGVTDLVLAGLHTHMCVRHTAADAYMWGYRLIVPTDGTDAFTEDDYGSGLAYLKSVYAASLTDCDSVIAGFASA